MTTRLESPPSGNSELYDPLFDTPRDDLYEVYACLRRDHPVYYSELRDVWCLSRHIDLQAAARDWRTLSSKPGGDLDTPNLYGPGNFLDDDPPRHDIQRKVVREFFLPKAIAQLESDIARRVDQIVSDLREKAHVDLARDFAARLPIWVICRLLGAPEAEDDIIQRLVLDAESHEPGQTAISDRQTVAVADLKAYLADLAELKRRHPDGKVLSGMVAAQADGLLTSEEVVGMAGILFAAGNETTFALLGNALNILAENMAAQDALRRAESIELVDAAIEEVLRYDGPAQYQARTVVADTTIRGVEIPNGARVVLVYGAANRDPERWERPDEFDIYRELKRHVAFGEGIHFCIGAPLARLEARIALPKFLRAFTDYGIGEKQRRRHHAIRGWERLDATLIPGG